MSKILDFYRGTGRDQGGRLLGNVWAFGFERLEKVHDFIQWTFPLREASRFNPEAPLLTDADVAAFRSDPELRQNLRMSFSQMMEFYGFDVLRPEGEPVSVTLAHPAARPWWAVAGDHNLLRLTRILASTRILGLEEESESLLKELEKVAEKPPRLPGRTILFWQETRGAR